MKCHRLLFFEYEIMIMQLSYLSIMYTSYGLKGIGTNERFIKYEFLYFGWDKFVL